MALITVEGANCRLVGEACAQLLGIKKPAVLESLAGDYVLIHTRDGLALRLALKVIRTGSKYDTFSPLDASGHPLVDVDGVIDRVPYVVECRRNTFSPSFRLSQIRGGFLPRERRLSYKR